MKYAISTLLAYGGAQVASMRVSDPSDAIPPSLWAADNAITADYRANATDTRQPQDVNADFIVNNTDVPPTNRVFTSGKNDTSVLLFRGGAKARLSDVEIQKSGYSTSSYGSWQYGLNSAVLIANGSTSTLSYVNITTHNGAPNVYVSGSGSRLSLDNAWLYSSGPSAPGISVTNHGSAIANYVKAYSGGVHSSIFTAQDSGGAFNVTNAFGHTSGIGSACLSISGQVNADSVQCQTEKAPMLLMDGVGYAKIRESSGIAGQLAAIVAYSSGGQANGAMINLDTVDLVVTGADMPGLWFGNTVATAYLDHVTITAQSKNLIVANRSSIAPEFDHFSEQTSNGTAQPAVVDIYVTNSRLVGNVVAVRDSTVNLHLGRGSSLAGTVTTDGSNAVVNVQLSSGARWTLTDRAEVGRLFSEDSTMRNIVTNGFDLIHGS